MMSQELEFHPAASIFPMMRDDEAIGLLEDIKENGQKYAAELYDGKVLDGRNRYLACLKLGIECETHDITDDVDDPVAHVLSVNLHRRHLTPPQCAIVGARSIEVYEKLAKERQKRKPNSVRDCSPTQNAGRASDAAGAVVGVSGKTIDRASKVISQGVPALVEVVDSGEVSVSKGAEIADLPKAQQPKAIKAAKQPKPVRKFPHSDQFNYWLDHITSQMTVMHQRHESVADMVADDKWDEKETAEIAERLRDISKTLSQYEKEFRDHEMIQEDSIG